MLASRRAPLTLLTLLALMAAACTQTTKPAITRKVIGAGGGTVTTADGAVTLDIPAGALGQDTTITITPSAASAPDLLPGTLYAFGPDGTVFAEPATLTLHYDTATLPAGGDEAQAQIAKLLDDGTLDRRSSQVDTTEHAVTAAIGGFSSIGVACCVALDAPDLRAAYQPDRSIELSWTWQHDTDYRGVALQLERVAKIGVFPVIPTVVDADFTVIVGTYNVANTSFTDRNIAPQPGFYYYRVRGKNQRGLGPPSNVVRVAVFGAQGRPGIPTNFRAIPASGSSVDLNWDDVDGAETFVLERRTGSDPFAVLANLPGTSLFHTDEGLTPDTTYDYRLKAINAAGSGGFAYTSATTRAGCSSFSLALSPLSFNAREGSSGRVGVTINRHAGFTGAIDLYLEGDTDVFQTASFDPGRATGASSALIYTLKEDIAPTNATLRIRGESVQDPSVQCDATLVVNVTAAEAGDCQYFNVTVTRDPVRVAPGGSTEVGISIERLNRFDGEIVLSLQALEYRPPGEEVLKAYSFTPNPVEGISTTLNLTIWDHVPAGDTYPVAVTGTHEASSASCRDEFTLDIETPVPERYP